VRGAMWNRAVTEAQKSEGNDGLRGRSPHHSLRTVNRRGPRVRLRCRCKVQSG
jgi:hypothetical protein